MTAAYRIFLSSPSDVEDERLAVQRVVDQINAARTADQPRFELFRWEEHFYTADSSFQDQVVQPAECDLVICIFWKRLGSELPPNYRRPDGTTPTGSEYEFEQALAKATEAEPKTPDIFVYLKTAPVVFAEETMAIEVEQRQKLLSFWSRWFHNEQGHFTAAYQKFEEIEAFEKLIERNLKVWLQNREPSGEWRGGSPFPGLRAYDVADGEIFFGRSRDIGRARARLFANAAGGAATLMISGASGAGKSSVLRAGLIASLIRPGGFAPHADIVHHIITTPSSLATGDSWASALASILLAHDAFGDALRQGDFDRPDALGAVLSLGGEAALAPLRKALERLKAAAPDGANIALVFAIDQFEEVFQRPPDEAEAFGALLCAMADMQGDGARFVILGSMRSDHRHRFDAVAALALLAGRDQVRGPNAPERFFDLAPPRPADLREIIAAPARAAGLTYQEDGGIGLAAAIEAEATGEALPALQLLLYSLYEDRAGDQLRFETYRRLGGVGGVMAKTAEDAYLAAPAAARTAFARVLRALVATSDDSGGAVARWASADAFAGEDGAEDLIDALKAAHLLRSEDRRLRVAHESLLTNWDRAADQIAADKRFFDIRARLGARTARWTAAEGGQAHRLLLRDFDLEEGRALIDEWGEAEVAEAAPDAPAFVRASISAARRRWLTAVVGAASAAALVLVGAFAAWTYRTEAAAAAEEAAIRLEVARANEALRVGEGDAALAAALLATDLAETAETRSVLAMAVGEASPHLVRKLGAGASALAWAEDGSLAGVFGGVDWRAEGGAWAASAAAKESDAPVLALSIGPSGWMGVRSDGAVASAAGVQAAEGFDLWRAGQIAVRAVGDGVLAALAPDSQGVWSLRCDRVASGPCAAARLPVPDATAIAFNPGGDQVIAAHQDRGGVYIARYAATDGAETGARAIAPGAAEVMVLAVSPGDGATLIGGAGGGLFLTPGDGEAAAQIGAYDAAVMALAWAPDGTRFAANCGRGDICLFASNGAQQARMTGGGRATLWIGFSPDGAHIASLDDANVVRIWAAAPDRTAASVIAGSRIEGRTTTALTGGAGRLAAGYADGVVRLWRAPDEPPAVMAAIGSDWRRAVRAVALSSSGRLAAIDANGDVAIWTSPSAGAAPDLYLSGHSARRLAFVDQDRLAVTALGGAFIVDAEGGASRLENPGPSPDGVTALPGGGFVLSNTRAAFPMFDASGSPRGGVRADVVNARLSASSLSAHPGGVWFAASRDDGVIRLYSTDQPTRVVDLPILSLDSKFVAFSPDGAKLAALDAGGNLYVWTFDADDGAASPFLRLPALPQAGAPNDQAREANGLAWLGPDCLAIASLRRGVFEICHDMTALKARARRLLSR